MSFTKKALLTAGAVVALATGLPGGQAWATPTCGTTTDLGTGGIVALSSITAGQCFQVQDKLYGNFNFGNLPTTTNLDFTLQTVSGVDHHGLAFDATYAAGTYTFGYEIHDITGPEITELDSDFTQTAGVSRLTKNTTPLGLPSTGVDITKVGAIPTAGSTFSIFYSPSVDNLVISEKLVDAGTVSSIINTVIERGPPPNVPEPASLAILGVGLVGLGALRRRFRKN